MRLIKMFLIVVIGLFAVLTIIGLVIPSRAKISRGIIIEADSATVYKALSDVKEWNQWLPWITADSGAIVQLSPITNAKGSYFKWKGMQHKNAGIITIQELKPQLIELFYQIEEMNDAEGGFRIYASDSTNQRTEVLWFMEYKLKWYPWERFYGIFIDPVVGTSFEQGLNNLKVKLEAKRETKLQPVITSQLILKN
jgi:hypothetical protein